MSVTSPQKDIHTDGLIDRIDLLRGIFAIWVLIAHTFELSINGTHETWWQDWPGRWFSTLFHSGYYGVTGFFFLSGFCIQWSISKKANSDTHNRFSYKQYLVARYWRIAPLFYIALLYAVAVNWICLNYLRIPEYAQTVNGDTKEFLFSLVFLQGIWGAYPLYGPSWSITNEAIYYLMWPIVLISFKFRYFSALIAASILAIISTSAFYFLWKLVGDQEEITMTALWCIPLAAPMWICGAACRIYYDSIRINQWFNRLKQWWWVILILWVIWTTTLSALDLSLLLRTILDPLSYIALPLLVLSDWKPRIKPKATKWLADLSYPLYLTHAATLCLSAACGHTFLNLTQSGNATIAAITSIIFAGTLGITIERYFLKLRNIITNRFVTNKDVN